MVTRIVVLFHMGKALDPVATEPEGFVFASGRVDKPPLPDVPARFVVSASPLGGPMWSRLRCEWLRQAPVSRMGCGDPASVLRLPDGREAGAAAGFEREAGELSSPAQKRTPAG